MAWTGRLERDQIRQLRSRYPGRSLTEIAMLAMEDPSYVADFDSLGARIETYEDYASVYGPVPPGLEVVPPGPEAFPRLVVPRGAEQAVARLVVAAMLGDDRPELRGAEPDLTGRPLPAFAVLYALHGYGTGASIRDVAKGELSFRPPAASTRGSRAAPSGGIWRAASAGRRPGIDWSAAALRTPGRCSSFAPDPF